MNEPQATSQRAPLPPQVVPVPVVQQRQGYSCGAAAALILLRYWHVAAYSNTDESELYAPLATTQARGTEPEPMVRLFRAAGLQAEYRHGDVRVADLERAVDLGEPPIVDLQAWSDRTEPWRDTWDAGHYVVMVGYDEKHLFFVDPSRATPGGYAFLPRDEFEDRWHDLAGDEDLPVARMAIFVRGVRRWVPPEPVPGEAIKLG